MLSYKEFKELAEGLNTTMITAVHNEGMRRHTEKVSYSCHLSPRKLMPIKRS